jgi:hypothetical protein
MNPAVELAEAPPDGTSEGPDAEKGKLFDVPRVRVIVDETDPTVIKLAFSGSVELDRTSGKDVAFYNDLAAGQECELVIYCHAAGATMRHRRDAEGDVDAIVQTKSLVVTGLFLERPE